MPITFNDLPSEVISNILSFLDREEYDNASESRGSFFPEKYFPRYVTISKAWQGPVERATFSQMRFCNTELTRFRELLTGYRRAALGVIDYRILLSPYGNAGGILDCVFETGDERARNNHVFTKAIQGLLAILNSWETEELGDVGRPIKLNIWLSEESYLFTANKPTWHDIRAQRYRQSEIELLQEETLCFVSRVTSFNVDTTQGRRLRPSSAVLISQCFPSLKSVNWALSDQEMVPKGLRTESRLGI
jgi:hypothetical protein